MILKTTIASFQDIVLTKKIHSEYVTCLIGDVICKTKDKKKSTSFNGIAILRHREFSRMTELVNIRKNKEVTTID